MIHPGRERGMHSRLFDRAHGGTGELIATFESTENRRPRYDKANCCGAGALRARRDLTQRHK